MRKRPLTGVAIAVAVCSAMAPQRAMSAEPTSPAVGYEIHVQAPHMMADGTPGGPFHHYCKSISDKILQCLLFESTDPKAPLVGVEYFVAKDLTRKLPAIQWHRHFHDHKVEIATGRVQVLDMPAEQAAKVAEAAAGTDGVIYHLWQHGQEFPDGTVSFPQSLGHKFPGYSDK
ncbi:MAG TPA: DUF1264 domain-containing protein [Nitrospira sp.]|nr:DUF1264 domain-containing protein [Nitrospira sp.]